METTKIGDEKRRKVNSSANIARHRELSVSAQWLQDTDLAENKFG